MTIIYRISFGVESRATDEARIIVYYRSVVGEAAVKLRIVQILPELDEGGVERHVLWLANGLASRGHEVLVVSAGGKLVGELAGAENVRLPVHLKNPLTAAWSAVRIAHIAKALGVQILHAHSRVPAWIAWWASCLSGIPWVATCHAFYSKNAGILPYRRANVLLCVSEAVREYFMEIFPDAEFRVVYNGLPPTEQVWCPNEGEAPRFLFVGRLVPKKGVDTLLHALSLLQDVAWSLDIVGDGPSMDDLQRMAVRFGIAERVFFHGFQEEPERWMAGCSCFLFPSHQEGMGLVLMRAVQMGIPVLGSDIPAVRELSLTPDELLPAGNAEVWRSALEDFLRTGKSRAGFGADKIPSLDAMVQSVEDVYANIA
ncbi:MAG: glycosyltransferase [Aminobacteriaceae bacterium]